MDEGRPKESSKVVYQCHTKDSKQIPRDDERYSDEIEYSQRKECEEEDVRPEDCAF